MTHHDFEKLGSLKDYDFIITHGGSGFLYERNQKDLLIEYFQNGEMILGVLDHQQCSAGCEEPIYTSILTDGFWIWENSIIHYLERHSMAPPHAFLEIFQENNTRKNVDSTVFALLENHYLNRENTKVVDIQTSVWDHFLDLHRNNSATSKEHIFTVPKTKADVDSDPLDALISRIR